MKKLEELLKQQAALAKQIKEATKIERAEALKTVKALCKQHNFTASMLKGVLSKGRMRKGKQ